jgi:hypothetical protein
MPSGGKRLGAGRKKKITYTDLSEVKMDAPIQLINGHSSFTKEQVAILSASPHVESITSKTISYTLVFKEAFWRRYMQGVMPDKIFQTYGIDPKILGENRIWGLVTSLRRLVSKGLPFANGREPSPQHREHKERYESPMIQDVEADDVPDLQLNIPTKPPRPPKPPRVIVPTVSRDDMQRLFHQVAYLTQEMEFLKKIILAGKNER